ncbi:L,D-transpeptidase [Thiosulfatihalobacter marinus]|uniref:L,D-transpeptidase n=2 Tax=Thiosulfatihalobacter marinus TaxID=2792481 RepID=UPI002FBD4CE0
MGVPPRAWAGLSGQRAPDHGLGSMGNGDFGQQPSIYFGGSSYCVSNRSGGYRTLRPVETSGLGLIMVKGAGRREFLAMACAAAVFPASGAIAHPFTLPEKFLPQLVNTRRSDWLPGEVHVTPDDFFLYYMLENGMAIRYGVGVGRARLYTPGVFTVNRKAEWPRWRPTNAMIRREPEVYAKFADGVAGGPSNPLGARALYLYDDEGHDTYLRIHGTNKPSTIGTAVSNGCARLTNEHIKDLYPRVEIGARVYLYPKSGAA